MNNIDTRQLNQDAKRSYWSEVVEKFLSSGQKLKEFTIQNGLNYDHLAYYLQQYRKKQKQQEPTEFIPVELTNTPVKSNYTIKVDNIEINLPATYSAAQLVSLITELRKA